MVWGLYPVDYKPSVHGPYDPAVFYGKKDTAFTQLKVGEVGGWFARRNKSPKAMVQCISRAWWRYQHKYMLPEKSGIAPIVQIAVGSMMFFYFINYPKFKAHRAQKYHW